MPEYGMLIDVSKCTGCYNCFLACKDEYCGNDYPGYSASQPSTGHYWMRLVEKERGTYPKVKLDYVPTPCMQCREASCIKSSKNGSVYRRSDGIVIIDPEKAKGQKEMVSSCPYRVIYWNAEKDIPQKCTLCAHLLDEGWKEPRCVELCPTGVFAFGDLDDPNSAPAKLLATGNAETLHPEYKIGEKVTYIGLPKKFVAGTVLYGDKDECAEGVTVTLSGNGGTKTAKTNFFGDFEFEGLPDDVDYKVNVKADGYKEKDIEARTRVDVYLGEIVLEK